jgi:hypothetical protein
VFVVNGKTGGAAGRMVKQNGGEVLAAARLQPRGR